MLVEVDDAGAGKVTVPGTTIKLMKTPGVVEKGAPLLGADTHEVLEGLGYDELRIETLRTQKIVSEG